VASLAELVVLAGIFVFMFGMLLVAILLVVPPIMPLVRLIFELGDGVSVELLGLLWLQPTSANAARTVIADSGMIDFIRLCFVFIVPVY
jgi:hypothetical protein